MNFLSIIATAAADTATATTQVVEETTAQAASRPNPFIQFLPFIAIIVLMFFFSIRSQKKQAAKRAEMMNKIVKGTEVLLANGIYAKIAEVGDKYYMVEVAPNVVIKVVEQGIAQVITPEDKEAKK